MRRHYTGFEIPIENIRVAWANGVGIRAGMLTILLLSVGKHRDPAAA